MNKHRWTYRENVIVFNGYLKGESAASISNETGISETSVKMKLANFKYLMTGSGLENCSKDSIRVVEEYIELSKKKSVKTNNQIQETHSEEFKAEVLRYLTRLEDKVTELDRKINIKETDRCNAGPFIMAAIGASITAIALYNFIY